MLCEWLANSNDLKVTEKEGGLGEGFLLWQKWLQSVAFGELLDV